MAQMVKRLPTMWETRVRSLGREDALEKEMATHSSTLAWRIPWTEEWDRLQSMESQRVGHGYATNFHFSLSSCKPGQVGPGWSYAGCTLDSGNKCPGKGV